MPEKAVKPGAGSAPSSPILACYFMPFTAGVSFYKDRKLNA
ncbi:hypothetical protein AN394_04214 [Pseudoalteromonas sp. P1-26]|nr:hypothetical protein AN394_04214 [Pseudoalteromonas sp. P1-26]